MAKRVDMISPFDALRGNVSGRQKLQYAQNNNPAYEAPEGTNYARNYKPRYVVAKNSKTGIVHFSVRTKNAAVNNTKTNRVQGALAAARSAYYKAMKDLTIVGKLMQLYGVSAAKANGESMYKWFVDKAIACYRQQAPAFTFSGTVGSTVVTVTIDNVFCQGTTGTPLALDEDVRVKFWGALARPGITFEIDDEKGIAFAGMTWGALVEDNQLNVLKLILSSLEEGEYIGKNGTAFLLQTKRKDAEIDEWSFVESDADILPNSNYYRWTTDRPGE